MKILFQNLLLSNSTCTATLSRLHALAETQRDANRVKGVLPAWLAEVWRARRSRLQEARALGCHQHKLLRKTVRGWTDAAEGGR